MVARMADNGLEELAAQYPETAKTVAREQAGDSGTSGFEAYARERGLSPEQTQHVLDFYQTMVAEEDKGVVRAWEQHQAQQRAALKAHPTLGGPNLEASQATAGVAIRALDRIGGGLGSKLVQQLTEAGLADHPVVAELFVQIGAMAKEDRSGGASSGRGAPAMSQEELARAMFPNTFAIMDKEREPR
jgi:hypothetical protein